MTIAVKLLFLLFVFLINDALFNTFDRFLVLIASLLLLFYLPAAGKKRIYFSFVILIAALVFKASFPLVQIKEGSQVFVYSQSGEFLENNLPAPLFQTMKSELQQYYPADKPCPEQQYCWKYYANNKYRSPTRLYAFSADWRKNEKDFSRIVSHIHFTDLQSFKLGAVNNIQYNYYANDIKRKNIPYYVKYLFPEQAVNSQLCFTGNLFIDEKGSFTKYLNQENKCLAVNQNIINKPLYFFSFNPQKPLAIETKGSIKNRYLTKIFVLFVLQFLALFLFVQLKKDHILNRYTIAILIAVPFNYLYFVVKRMRLWPGDFIIYEGGDDGLVHDSKGRWIINNILNGNWYDALRSDESVFYFMPGLRYLKVPDMMIFGESTYAVLLISIIFAIVVFYLIREAFKLHSNAKNPAYFLFLTFLFIHVPKSTGLRFEEYIASGFIGYPGVWSFLLIGIFILYFLRQNGYFTAKQAFWLCAALSLAIIIRPNYAILASILSAYCLFINRHHLRTLIYMLLGFTIALLPLAHNVYFGNSFHLLTSNAMNPANLIVVPADYIKALTDPATAVMVKNQLLGFIIGEQVPVTNGGIIKWTLLALFRIAILYFIVSRLSFLYKSHQHYFYLALALLAQHSTFLFWRTHRRYMMFIFLLEILVAIYAYYAHKKESAKH